MQSNEIWVKRFLWMTGVVFMVLMGAALMRGGALEDELSGAFGWALVSAGIFTGWRYNKARHGVAGATDKED